MEPLIDRGPRAQIDRIVQRFGTSSRGVAVYDRSGTLVAATSQWAAQLRAPLPAVPLALADIAPKQGFQSLGERATYYYAVPLVIDQRAARCARHPGRRHAHRPRALGAGTAAPHTLRRVGGGAQPGHPGRRAPQRHSPAEPPGGLGAPAPGRTAWPAAAHVGSGSLRAAGVRGEGSRPEPGQGTGGHRGRGASPPPGRGGVDRGAADAVRPGQARRPPPGGGLQSRAGEPRAAGARDRPADAGERRGHGDGAHHARVRRRLGRPRER